MIEGTPGHCPLCESEAGIGMPCSTPSCAAQGLCGIPKADFETRRDAEGLLDPRLGKRIGDYLLVGKLGEGGMGAVYLALQMPIGLKAALKVLTKSVDGLVERFQGEAAALAHLNHPNIVRLLKYGVHRERPYLVMEYVEGQRTLKDAMQTGLDQAAAGRILDQIASALMTAHAQGIVHRDIKPENIMLQALPDNPHFVRVVDFGLAKFTEDSDVTSIVAGTPVYMAPEQFARENIGPWTDVFALGGLAFAMLGGQRPYTGLRGNRLYVTKMDMTFDAVDALGPTLGPELLGFLRAAMAHPIDQRIASAADFRTRLRAVLHPEPIKTAVAPVAGSSRPGMGIWVAGGLVVLAAALWWILHTPQRVAHQGAVPESTAPETVAPIAPVTAAPVTVAPVTVAPVAPVTVAPVTPVTAAPQTAAPATAAPKTVAPETAAPETAAPQTTAPKKRRPKTRPKAPKSTQPASVKTVDPRLKTLMEDDGE